MGSVSGAMMTAKNLKKQNKLLAEAQGKQAFEEKQAENKKAATAVNVDSETATDLSKKKKGVQSTFVASTGAGAGMSKGTTMTPIGG